MAGTYESGKRNLHAGKVCQFLSDVKQLAFSQNAGFFAMCAIFQPKQFGDFIQTESQSLGRFHELHPRDVGPTVAADAAVETIRFGQQTPSLVEADRLDIDPGRLGEGPDGQVLQIVFHFA